MFKEKLTYFKSYYIDAVDPEGNIAKLAFRTAFACTISILLFQVIGNFFLSSWAGFATFAFVQNDTQERFSNRFSFLIAIIILFTLLVFAGMLIGKYLLLYFITIPVIVLVSAYCACLGYRFFNASGWALFLYILAGSNPADVDLALQIGKTFLICGCISIAVCFLVFPSTPYRRMTLNYNRILSRVLLLLKQSSSNYTEIARYNSQLETLLELQDKEISIYLEENKLTIEKQTIFINLGKLFYQLSLMAKSTVVFQQLPSRPASPVGLFNHCNQVIEEIIQEIISQIKYKQYKQPPDFSSAKKQLSLDQEYLTSLRKIETEKIKPDFISILDYSDHLYHFLKLLELLEKISKNISKLYEKR